MYFFKDEEEEEKKEETTKVMARSALAKLALKNTFLYLGDIHSIWKMT